MEHAHERRSQPVVRRTSAADATVEAAAPSAPVPMSSGRSAALPDQLRSGVEALSGHALDDVRVHYDSPKPAQLQAHAFAQGSEIHLAPGQERHLPHEAWHVVQQKQGRVAAQLQTLGAVTSGEDASLDREAAAKGAEAAGG